MIQGDLQDPIGTVYYTVMNLTFPQAVSMDEACVEGGKASIQ